MMVGQPKLIAATEALNRDGSRQSLDIPKARLSKAKPGRRMQQGLQGAGHLNAVIAVHQGYSRGSGESKLEKAWARKRNNHDQHV